MPRPSGVTPLPKDPLLANQWSWFVVCADEAWRSPYHGQGTLVAVIDTGVDYLHPDLDKNIWTNPKEIPLNSIDDDQNGWIDDIHGYDFADGDGDPMDPVGHGTHIAGIIAAIADNKIGIAGVAPAATIMPIRIAGEHGCLWENLELAIQYATQNDADIICIPIAAASLSWMRPLRRAINEAYVAGAILVGAAGNEQGVVRFPASYGRVIAVSATKKDGLLAEYSNFGPEIEFASPGGDEGNQILSTWKQGEYKYAYGTSMAAAHVAGVVAVLLSRTPGLQPDEVRQTLRKQSRDLGLKGRDEKYGYGLVIAVPYELGSAFENLTVPWKKERGGIPISIFKYRCTLL